MVKWCTLLRSGNVLTFIRQYRVITVLMLTFMMYMGLTITDWYIGLENPNNSQGAFASAILLAIVGLCKYWMETRANDEDSPSN